MEQKWVSILNFIKSGDENDSSVHHVLWKPCRYMQCFPNKILSKSANRIFFRHYTLFKDVHILKLQQDFSIIIISNINLVVTSHWVFHPGTFISAICVVWYGFCDCGHCVLAFPCKQEDSPLWRSLKHNTPSHTHTVPKANTNFESSFQVLPKIGILCKNHLNW